MSRLSICAIFKNEAPYLLEWIAYHRAVGFDHFYLYDNDSTDGGSLLIQRSPFASCVTLTQWGQRPGQLSAYRDFIAHHRASADWVAFIDIDEFLLPSDGRSVRPLLQRLNAASAVLVHWRVFGPSGWVGRPDGLVIDNYTQRAEDDFPANRHVKSIVKCAELLDVAQNPHEFRLRGPTCDTSGRMVPNVAIQAEVCHHGLVINHYQTRSHQDWLEKIARGSAMIEQQEPKYEVGLFDHYAEVCTVRDEAIRVFAPEVRAAVAAAEQQQAADPVQPGDWQRCGDSAWERWDGTGLVFCDRGRSGMPWIAGLRGAAAKLTDPTLLTDSFGRVRDFPNDAEAMTACDEAVSKQAAG
jgi:hypothetical protein